MTLGCGVVVHVGALIGVHVGVAMGVQVAVAGSAVGVSASAVSVALTPD